MKNYERIEKSPDSLELSREAIEKMGEMQPMEISEPLSKEDLPQPCELNRENYEIAFLGDSISEARNRKASSLESDLYSKNIHISGYYEFDSDHGGFNKSTGKKIHDALDKARGEERISDYIYKDLMNKLDDACFYQ